ncbi:MAG: gliding motility-associated C-terminal domain-containing protein [Saprospiraceae bacterium]
MLSIYNTRLKGYGRNTHLHANKKTVIPPGLFGLLLLFTSLPFWGNSQVIWQEHFDTIPEGTQQSPGRWTTAHHDCDPSPGTDQWGVYGGRFVVQDMEGFNCADEAGDGQNTFTTAFIDISSYPCVQLSIDLDKAGELNCSFPAAPFNDVHGTQDQIVVTYSVNGGDSWQPLAYICGDSGLPMTVSTDSIQGDSLSIKITIGNKTESGVYFFDNIIIEAASLPPTLPAIGPFCHQDSSILLPTAPDNITGTWSGPGLTDSNTFHPSLVDPGVSTLTFSPDPGQCADTSSLAILVNLAPEIQEMDDVSACDFFTLPVISGTHLTGNQAYFTAANGLGDRLQPGDRITSSITLFIYDAAGGCADQKQFTITIIPQPVIDDLPDQVACDFFVLPTITGTNISNNVAYFSGTNGTNDRFSPGDTIRTDRVLFIWDNNVGCLQQQAFQLTINSSPQVSLSPENITCAGAAEGQITSNVISGSSPFTYDWNVDQFDGMPNLSDLEAGSYYLTVTDGNDCQTIAAVSLSEPEMLALRCAENTPVSIVGGNDGIASITFSGGVAPYTLAWDNGNLNGGQNQPTADTISITQLAAGNYSLVLTDANNCTSACHFTITDPNCHLGVTATAIDLSCHDAQDGQINLTLANGEPPFTFIWSDPSLDGLQNPSNLQAGTYLVTVSDNNGCQVLTSSTVTAPRALQLNGLSTTGVQSAGASDGRVAVNIQGGTAPYLLAWSGPLNGSQAAAASGLFALDGLPEGTYSLQLTDNNDCTTTIDFTIAGFNCRLNIALQGTDLSCNGNQTGRILLTIQNGISPFEIDWGIDTLDGQRLLNNLTAGTYTVSVKDGNGCQTEATTTLTEPSALSLDCGLVQEASAPGRSDGSATIQVAGGTPHYTVDWDNSIVFGSEHLSIPGAINLKNLSEGNYTVFLFDDNSCMTSCNFFVEEACLASENNILMDMCPGEQLVVNGRLYDETNPSGKEVIPNGNALGCDSIIHITLRYFAAASANVEMVLCMGESLSIGNQLFDELNPSGTAILPNASSHGCDSMVQVSLSFLPAPGFSLEGDNSICLGEETTITFRTDFSDPVDIIVTNESGVPMPLNQMTDGATFTVWPNQNATYHLEAVIMEASNCPAILSGGASIIVSNPAVSLVATDYNGFQISCPDALDGQLESQIEDGIPPYSYQWSNGENSAMLSDLAAGLYEVTITDAVGCQSFSEALLSAPVQLSATINTISPTCIVGNGQIVIQEISGGAGPFSFSLNGAASKGIAGLPFSINGLEAGTYSLSIIDANACDFYTNVVLTPEEPLLLDLGIDQTISLGEAITLEAISNFTIDHMVWEPGDSVLILDTNQVVLSPTHTTSYTATAFDASGCAASDQITILVDRKLKLFQPNVFSPNNDGVNDVFGVFGGQGIVLIKQFTLLDRWGKVIYQANDRLPNDPTLGWDGTFKGQPMSTGVYVYLMEVVQSDGKVSMIRGEVTLIR